MSITFTKLFSSITESTVWCEPDSTRIVWITMLAMADRKGRVWGSIPGLANRARVSIEQCENALITFKSPDRYSRTPDNEGRRIADIEGGWTLLNYEKHRSVQDDESIRESKRKWAERNRNAKKVEKVEVDRLESRQAEAEAEAEAEATIKTKSKTTTSAARFDAAASLAALGVDDQIAKDWIKHRTAIKTTVTQTVINGHVREAAKARLALSDVLAMSCERGWRGFKAEWVADAVGYHPKKSQKQINDEATTRAIFGHLTQPMQIEKTIIGEVL